MKIQQSIPLILPILFGLHVAEEFFFGFMPWHVNLFNSNLSNTDFLIINGCAFFIIDANGMLHVIKKGSNYFTAVIGTLFLINGIIHILISAVSTSYSPGTFTGIMLYLPLGIITIKQILPLLPEHKRKNVIMTSILIQIGIAVIAMNV